jgi:hypothetical protein
MLDRALNVLTSLRLTVVCLCLALILVFIGTLAQVNEGLYQAQNRYFRSVFVYWTPQGSDWRIPVFPGGWLIGSVLLLNLLAAHLDRFKASPRKAGILITHGGLLLLLTGGLLTDLFQVESHMRLVEGEARSYSENGRLNELVLIDTTDPKNDRVASFAETQLGPGVELAVPGTALKLRVRRYYANSEPRFQPAADDADTATQGVGQRLHFQRLERTTKMDARDIPGALIEVTGEGGSLGRWWVSNWFNEQKLAELLWRQASAPVRQALETPQQFTHQGRTYLLAMRPMRYYEPYNIALVDFRHDRYMGTEIPKNFSSRVRVQHSETGEDREVLIYMNNPLRYGGKTYYQAGFDDNDPRVTILQVVRNPSWLLPYISCTLVTLGLLVQFAIHLAGFAGQRRGATPAGRASAPPGKPAVKPAPSAVAR